MNTGLDEQFATATAAMSALLSKVLPGAVEVELPLDVAAQLCHDDYRMCRHLARLPVQPTVFDRQGLARCSPCFAVDWIIRPRLACQLCANPEATAVVAARVGHMAVVLAVCASCRPPDLPTE